MMVRCLNCMKEFDEQYGVCPYCGHIPNAEPEEAYQLCQGIVLAGRYVIGTALGVGGFGITYKAWDEKLQMMIAIKEYYPSANGIVNRAPGEAQVIIYSGERAVEFEKGKARFLAEARHMAKFNTHPNIVHVFDFFEENGTAYIVMEYLDGVSYKQFIKHNGGVVTLDLAREITLCVLDALKEIHKSGIIHRDISPDNVFICQGGIIKLIDFGAARFSTGEEEKTLSIILKPGYAPPEQYRSKSRQGPWTDIYAVGAMFYRAVTGKIPDESVNRIVNDLVVPPNQINPEIPENISNSIMRSIALDYELRFKNVDQFRDALQDKAKVLDVGTELKRRKKSRFALVSLVLILLVAVGGYSVNVFINKRAQAALADAAIVVWYPAWENTGSGWQDEGAGQEQSGQDQSGGTAGFNRITELFRSYYPNIRVEIEAIPAEEYEEKLLSAIASGKLPTVFDSSCLGPEHYEYMMPLEETFSLLKQSGELDKYYFLNRYEEYYPEQKQLPTSFQIPVIYANRLIAGEEIVEIGSKEQLSAVIQSGAGYSVDPGCIDAYRQLEPSVQGTFTYEDFLVELDSEETTDVEALDEEQQIERMLENRVGYYLSDTSQYQEVQSDMAGIYRVILLKDFPLTGQFTNMWSVSSSGSDAETRAGMRFLYFLLSKENQQISTLQYDNGLPLHKEVFEEFETMNTEFSGLNQCIGQLTLEPYMEGKRE